jgi:hypothetical protein
MSYEQVEEAWKLCEAAAEYIKKAGREVPIKEIMDNVFIPSPLVDLERTKGDTDDPPKVFLKSPYGIRYSPENKNWIPFRHGPVKISLD